MGLPREACPYGIILFVLVVFSLTGGCICGLSSPGQPDAVYDNRSADLTGPGADAGTVANRSEAGSPVTSTPMPAPTPRPSAFTIYAEGGKDHRPGETLRLYGMDTYSGVVYLYLSSTKVPISGGRLDDLQKPVVDQDVTTFTRVNVSGDDAWEYYWAVPSGQPALMFDLYNVIAASEPRDKPHLDQAANWGMVTVKISEYQG